MRLDVDWYRGSNCEHVFSICTYNHGQVYNVRSCDITHSQLPVGPNLFLNLYKLLREKQIIDIASRQTK